MTAGCVAASSLPRAYSVDPVMLFLSADTGAAASACALLALPPILLSLACNAYGAASGSSTKVWCFQAVGQRSNVLTRMRQQTCGCFAGSSARPWALLRAPLHCAS